MPRLNPEALTFGTFTSSYPPVEQVVQSAQALEAATVVAVPSPYESLSLLALEAFSVGTPVLANARSGKKQIRSRIDNIRELVSPRLIRHYDRLSKARPPALVPVEGDTCQGCFMKLPSQFVQQVRQDPEHIHTCPNCSRYIYVV